MWWSTPLAPFISEVTLEGGHWSSSLSIFRTPCEEPLVPTEYVSY
jgi:hypothetical protein